jgi:hypothetical protein
VNIGRSFLKVKAALSLYQTVRRHSISAPRHEKKFLSRSEVITAVLIKIQVFRDVTPLRLVNSFCSSEAWLDLEDGGNALFRNICNYLPVDTA